MSTRTHRGEQLSGRIAMLGVAVDAIDRSELINALTAAIHDRRRLLIGNHNLHSIALHRRDSRMREFYARADLVVIDGMPVVRWARLRGHRVNMTHRLAWLDELEHLLRQAVARNWRVAHIGGRPGVGEMAIMELRRRYPGLHLDTRHGYFAFPGPEDDEAVRWLRDRRPDLIFVGMGMPRQERWILHHLDALPPCPILTSGATFDYLAGVIPTAPRWMGRVGIEWMFRLASEPRRLAHRYLVEPFSLLPEVYRDLRGRSPRGGGGA